MENPDLGDDRKPDFIPYSFPVLTDTIDNIPHLSALEKFYADEINDNNRLILLRSEQNIEAFIMTLVNSCTKSGDLILDPFMDRI